MFYDNIPAIKEVFFEFGSPYWRLHDNRGNKSYPSGRTKNNGLLFAQERDTETLDSWNILEGKLRLFTNRGGYAHLYQGTPDEYIHIPIFFPHHSESQTVGNNNPLSQLTGLGMPYDLRTAIEKERENWELKKRLEDLENAQLNGGSFAERAMERIMESEQFPVVVSQLLGALSRVGVQQSPPTIGAQQVSDNQGGPRPQLESGLMDHFETEQEAREYIAKMDYLLSLDKESIKNWIDGVISQVKAKENEQ